MRKDQNGGNGSVLTLGEITAKEQNKEKSGNKRRKKTLHDGKKM